jgi:uncharacterized membrane protein YfcA
MEEKSTYSNAVAIFAILVVAILLFSGVYVDIRLTLIALPILVFLVVLFLGWSNNKNLNKSEMRRAITAALATAFIVIVVGSQYLTIPSELRNYFLGVFSTIIGFYFGYRSRESQEQRESTQGEGSQQAQPTS